MRQVDAWFDAAGAKLTYARNVVQDMTWTGGTDTYVTYTYAAVFTGPLRRRSSESQRVSDSYTHAQIAPSARRTRPTRRAAAAHPQLGLNILNIDVKRSQIYKKHVTKRDQKRL